MTNVEGIELFSINSGENMYGAYKVKKRGRKDSHLITGTVVCIVT